MIDGIGLTKRHRIVLYGDRNMAKARRKQSGWHLGAARLIVAGCLAAAIITLWQNALQSRQPRLTNASDREAVMFDAAPAAVSPISWSAQNVAPLFGLATEPVAGQVGAKWRPVEADIERELDG